MGFWHICSGWPGHCLAGISCCPAAGTGRPFTVGRWCLWVEGLQAVGGPAGPGVHIQSYRWELWSHRRVLVLKWSRLSEVEVSHRTCSSADTDGLVGPEDGKKESLMALYFWPGPSPQV